MAHPREQERDRAHPDAADTHDVDRARRGQVEQGQFDGLRFSGADDRVPVHRATCSTRSASRAAASGRAERARGSRHRVESLRVGEQPGHDRVETRRVALGIGHDDDRARAANVVAFCAWWSLGAPGRGTSTAGNPAAVSSATVPAPARQTATAARSNSAGMFGS